MFDGSRVLLQGGRDCKNGDQGEGDSGGAEFEGCGGGRRNVKIACIIYDPQFVQAIYSVLWP